MSDTQHKALKIKESAQAAIHGKISSMNQKDLVRYFASRKPGSSRSATAHNQPVLVCEPPSEYPKTTA